MKLEPAFQPCDSAVRSSTTTWVPPTLKEPLSTLRSVSSPIVLPVTPVRYSVSPPMREGALRSGLVAVTSSIRPSFLATSGDSWLPLAMETT